MGVVDWRAWTDQNGGQMPTAPNPPGTPYVTNSVFPGVGPIPFPDAGQPTGVNSIPPYPSLTYPNAANAPQTVNAIDPFYVGTYPNGGGWVNKMSEVWYDWSGAMHTWPAGSPGSTVPAGPIMRPAIPGLTSP
jgi:hypothetical protein